MSRAYSVDLRERSLRALTSGMPAAEVARLFDVSEASLYRWQRRQRERGDLTPDRPPGRPPRLDVAARDALRAQVATPPDATLAEHCAEWAAEHGTAVSPATMCRTLARLGLARKKRR
jgi:transposase